jgi:hypothetical protein
VSPRPGPEISGPGTYRLYKACELDELPPPEWLIAERIPRNAIVALIGAKGSYKTFVALDLSCHIATGLTHHGRQVTPGSVVYVFSEGAFGARARIDAWCALYAERSGLPLSRNEMSLWLLPSRIPINNAGAVAQLIGKIRDLGCEPSLIVIDTLNQNLDGGEDDKGMGGFVTGCVQLRDRFGATVLVAHHTPLGAEDRGRGHTAFDGAIDTRLIVSRDAERATLECNHQRNGPDGWSIAYELVDVGPSKALKPSSPTGGKLNGKRRELLEAVSHKDTMSYTEWLRESGAKPPTFKVARKWLLDNAYVKMEDHKYAVTEAGRLALRIPKDTGGIP